MAFLSLWKKYCDTTCVANSDNISDNICITITVYFNDDDITINSNNFCDNILLSSLF